MKKLWILLLLTSSAYGQYMEPMLGEQIDHTGIGKGIVGCWLFNENPGKLGKVYDVSGNGNQTSHRRTMLSGGQRRARPPGFLRRRAARVWPAWDSTAAARPGQASVIGRTAPFGAARRPQVAPPDSNRTGVAHAGK